MPKLPPSLFLESALYKTLVRPLLFQMDVEEAHNLGHKLLPAARALLESSSVRHMSGLENFADLASTSIAGHDLPHPVGLAAGFDKNARLLADITAMGFSFAEIGSVTALSSPGNERPRLFRLPKDEAVINRLGLNGEGARSVSRRLSINLADLTGGHAAFALNIAPTNHAARAFAGVTSAEPLGMAEDIAACFSAFCHLPLAYVTINTSCPNTHDGVLRESEELRRILALIANLNINQLPIYLKFSPDSSDEFLDHATAAAREYRCRGFVLGNTSISAAGRDALSEDAAKIARIGNGGLSGRPINGLMLSLVRRVALLKDAEQEIIAVGGISSAGDIIAAVRSGARAVQIYTSLIYEGPFQAIKLRRDLTALLARLDCPLVSLIGKDLV